MCLCVVPTRGCVKLSELDLGADVSRIRRNQTRSGWGCGLGGQGSNLRPTDHEYMRTLPGPSIYVNLLHLGCQILIDARSAACPASTRGSASTSTATTCPRKWVGKRRRRRALASSLRLAPLSIHTGLLSAVWLRSRYRDTTRGQRLLDLRVVEAATTAARES